MNKILLTGNIAVLNLYLIGEEGKEEEEGRKWEELREEGRNKSRHTDYT